MRRALYDPAYERRDEAKRLLLHYLNIAHPGLRDDNDARVEIGEIVDAIVDAAVITIQHEQKA